MSEAPHWSAEEAALLRHAQLITEVLRISKPPAGPEAKKPRWLEVLESGGGAALFTVLLGGILGNMVACGIQQREKERDFQRAWMQARGDQALVAYKEYLDREQDLVKDAYQLLGSSLSASSDLIVLTGKEWASPSSQKIAIVNTFNAAQSSWSSRGEQLKLLMSYYHRGHPEVAVSWTKVQNSGTNYMACSRQWYITHQHQPQDATALTAVCKDEKDKVSSALDEFARSLEGARQYAWEGWESPEKLRSVLGESANGR